MCCFRLFNERERFAWGFRSAALLWFLGLAAAAVATSGREVCLEETFADLDRWEPHTFPAVPRESVYAVEEDDEGNPFLLMTSDGGGSGIVLKEPFRVRDYPVVEWRWRVDKAIEGVDHLRRDGDDYPARLYVFFEYERQGLDLGTRIRYRAYRALRGEFPPHSGLTYVWTAVSVEEDNYPSPYTDRVGMFVLRGEDTPLGEWREESIHILEDYERFFGEDPPETARIAIMTDSDDTGQSTAAAIDFIRIVSE